MNQLDPQFDPQQFLKNHWQKKPVLLRGLYKDFSDPIDEHDLAGLATEQHVDSRIVSKTANNEWTNEQGPFDNFETVCKGQWTLLVQGVDRYLNDVDSLMQHFTFIPYWRMDDVMVSYSVKGAGVGAHIDQYDVFLIQGKGRRRWQVGTPDEYAEIINQGLRQIDTFDPVIDVITEPGDVLYIPPNWPHRGETIEDAFTYSIGFRAPDVDQLITAFQDGRFSQSAPSARFCDPQRQPCTKAASLSVVDIQKLKQLLIDSINNSDVDQMLARYFSEQNLNLHTLNEDDIDIQTIAKYLVTGIELHRVEGVRPIYTEQQSDAEFTFYIDGMRYSCPVYLSSIAQSLLNQPVSQMIMAQGDSKFVALCQLIYDLLIQGAYEIAPL